MAVALIARGRCNGIDSCAAVQRKVEGATTTNGKRGATAATTEGAGTNQRAMTAAERAEETASATRDRLSVAYASVDGYCRQLRNARNCRLPRCRDNWR